MSCELDRDPLAIEVPFEWVVKFVPAGCIGTFINSIEIRVCGGLEECAALDTAASQIDMVCWVFNSIRREPDIC